ncbi:hypothetical protein [Mesorhizobium sp. BE184]|uniref:hypothetical protein n=1 Tax=Mesorhizobium sp. BE184 TaxID=2817714 RepID=UPI00286756A5|nr:hypothetical protein [Mesorhizobium sp. BE184]MDR7032426.1 hypothetical protein [Mesorhizobium sp. BE184]
MADVRRLIELSMVPPLAQEVATQISAGVASKAEIAALTAIATADATDPATTMALANINKAKINAIIAALKA